MRKTLSFVAVFAVVVSFASSSVLANDNRDMVKGLASDGVNFAGHVTKTVVVRVPAAVLETGGDVVRTTGNTVGTAMENTGGWWRRTGDRVFGLLRR